MSNFTNETNVRLKTQLQDTEAVSSDLVNGSIDDAHTEIEGRLLPGYPGSPVEDGLVKGETLLASGYLLRSVASGAVDKMRKVKLGDKGVDVTERWSAFLDVAERFESEAWEVLLPYLEGESGDGDFQVSVTDTVPIFGK